MIEFQKRESRPEVCEGYFKRIGEYMDRNLTRELGPKSETGSNRSESGYQRIAASTCGQIAQELGCSEAKARALSMLAGICFPKYGHRGVEAIRQYIADHGIDLDQERIQPAAMCYYISSHAMRNSHFIVAAVACDLIEDYCSGAGQYEESRIVRLVQETILDVKKAEPFYEGNPGDLLFDATRELVDLAKEKKVLTRGILLEKYREQIDACQFPPLTEVQRSEVYDMLDKLVYEFSHYPKGLESHNQTPEETVLMYIVSGLFC